MRAAWARFAVAACAAIALLSTRADAAEPSGRETLNFNQGWRFHRVDPTSPPVVQLPASALVARGEFPDGAAATTITFGDTTARFVALESTRSQRPDDAHAAIAELDLIDAAGHPLDRARWRVAYASSEEPGNPATAILDGRADTFWHSRYTPEPFPHHPHLVVIDLGEAARFSGFRYLPRPSALPGRIKGFRFYAARDPFPLPPPAATAELDGSPADFADTDWELVNVPHPVRLEPWNASGEVNFRGLCWYRKHFMLADRWHGKRMTLQFGGAMQVADVWLNGHHITTHFGGYLPFTLDVTDDVRFGSDNVIALRLDNRDQPLVPPGKPEGSLDFDYFGGLYRDVHFVVTEPVHVSDPMLADRVAGGGVQVTFPLVSAGVATLAVKTDVATEWVVPQLCDVEQELLDADGHTVASVKDGGRGSIPAMGFHTFLQRLVVNHPHLWHPNHPYLYLLRTRIGGIGTVDQVDTPIGIRTFEFRPDGLFINGERFFSVGFNHHQDFPYLGVAVPDALQYRDVAKLRAAGMTSFRSHYPHAPAFMDACDRLGVLTIVSTPGWQYFKDDPTFLARSYQDTREMVRLNRNRPSVVLWEVGLNESGYSEAYARAAHRAVHEEFPDGPCYTSGDARLRFQRADPIFDVTYNGSFEPPKRPMWWREFGDNVDMNWGDQVSDNRVARGYGEAALLLQATSLTWAPGRSLAAVYEQADAPYCGADLWAGIDCDRGYHPTPFLGGILDKGRLPKFSYYAFAAQRPPGLHVAGVDDGPVVFMANLMTRFSPKDVTVFSNCEQVRLLRSDHGKPFAAVATLPVVAEGKLPHGPVVFKAALPETVDGCRLRAEGLIGGQVVAQQSLGTAGVPRRLVVTVDDCGRPPVADGSDVVVVHAAVVDRAGNTATWDDRSVTFAVDGPGDVVGDASIEANPARAELGIATALVRTRPSVGRITVRATARGLPPAEASFDALPLAEPVVPGRDVGRFVIAAPTVGATTTPAAAMPPSEVMQAQQSQDAAGRGPQR
jgi:beta-galactosidase